MLYLLWALINIGIFIFFILTCIRATKLIREKFGLFAAIIFVFGLLSFVSAPNTNNNENRNQLNPSHTRFNADESIEMYSGKFVTVPLERNLVSSYGLVISYGISKEEHLNIPVTASSHTLGLVSGTKWIPASITVNQTDDNKKFRYQVIGTVEWRLLGYTIYSQSKSFKGTVVIK